MYFDAVLDNNMIPVFNGTPQDTLKWLEENPWAHNHDVCVGRTMTVMPAKEYIEKHRATSLDPSEEQ